MYECVYIVCMYVCAVSRRNVRVFGINDGGRKHQYNLFLWDYVSTGNPNCTIGLLDYFLNAYYPYKRKYVIHTDSVFKENRSREMLTYHAARIVWGEADQIIHFFFAPYHGKNLCDGCYGVQKSFYRKCSSIYSMEEVAIEFFLLIVFVCIIILVT